MFDVRRLMAVFQEMGSGRQESVHPTELNRAADAYHLAIAAKDPTRIGVRVEPMRVLLESCAW